MRAYYFFLIFPIFFSTACDKVTTVLNNEPPVTFLFLYTNDEHGHIYEKDGWYKGAELNEMWEEEEKACEGCVIFRISGGDSYTGSSVSSLFDGESMAAIMGIIDYQVSAVGNHEFDFGIQAFESNRAASGVEYLSSNIIFSDLKNAFLPSLMFDSPGGKVSFTGSTTEELKQIAFASYLKNVRVMKPVGPVGRELIKNRDIADLQVLIAHESMDSAKSWVPDINEKPLIVFTGHDHSELIKNYNDILFVQTSGSLKSYARIEVVKKNGKVFVTKADIIALRNQGGFKAKNSIRIKEITDDYLEKLEKKAGQHLIRSVKPFEFEAFQKLYACSLLNAFPEYEVAMSNPGAFRDSINKGVVKKSDIISMLPFQNRIVLSSIKGKDLLYNLNLSGESYCGVKKENAKWLFHGSVVESERKYNAVIHEYIYSGGDYYKFIVDDADNQITSRDWREPLERYLIQSSAGGFSLEEAYASLMVRYER